MELKPLQSIERASETRDKLESNPHAFSTTRIKTNLFHEKPLYMIEPVQIDRVVSIDQPFDSFLRGLSQDGCFQLVHCPFDCQEASNIQKSVEAARIAKGELSGTTMS